MRMVCRIGVGSILLLTSCGVFSMLSVVAADPVSSMDIRQLDHDRIVNAANQYLADQPVTITAYPAPRSAGGLHDYFSEADYYWPDESDPDGPYVNRDGMSNPNIFNKHREAMRRLSIEAPSLVAAYLITHDRKYSDRAIDHLRAWCVDPATKMNPSLLYSQAIHGKATGRSIGIIDSLHLVEVAQAVIVLRQNHAIDPQVDADITRWFATYITWLTTHPYGIEESRARNNHATCYWLQVAEFAELTGDQARLHQCRERYKEQLLPQMAPDGSFPAELQRTKPYAYSLFDLDQMVMLCEILSTPSDDLWHFSLPGGQSIAEGMKFMYPFIKDKSAWKKKPDVMCWEFWPVRSPALLFTGLRLNEPQYIDLWKTLNADPTNDEVLRNMEIHQPVLWIQ
jgi:Alginate lyase